MSLPKEPRQKMINMMYLVLTALLALNVTSEVLNAFKTVNNSLLKSTGVINDKNTDIYNSLAEKAKDPQTAAKAAPWVPRAEKVKQMAADNLDGREFICRRTTTTSQLRSHRRMPAR